MLIKKMAESRGFKAQLEELTPDGKGRVDVSLERAGRRIACVISATTTDNWGIHNVEKCLVAGCSEIIVCYNDLKNLEKVRRQVKEALDVACEKDVKEADTLKATIKSLNDKQTALIEKNAKGVIGDSVLRRQLEQIEYILTKAHADLYALPEKPEDIGELLDFTREYLETPGNI